MKEVTVKLYQFDELSDKAKQKAREWWREAAVSDEPEMEQYETAAELLGITLSTNTVQLMGKDENGKHRTRQEPDIRYSGFWSQGDGASFVGTYKYRKGCSKLVREEFGRDEKLWAIADRLTALQKKHGYALIARITQSGHYVHKYTMDVEITGPQSVIDADTSHHEPSGVYVRSEPLNTLTELMRDFAQWIYDGLREEYEYRMSDENVDEAIRANEYDFRENGERSDG